MMSKQIIATTAMLLTSLAWGQGTWEGQQAYAEAQTANYLASYPSVLSDRFVFKTVELPEGGSLELDLRVERPASGGPFPVVFFVHGGGWITGSKAHFCHQSFELAKHGIAGVRLEYRWESHGAKYPEAISDVLDAIAYVRERAVELNLDFSRVGLAGGSAGGHLSAMAAQLTPECICYDGYNGLYDAYDLGRSHFGSGDYTGTNEAQKKAASAIYNIKQPPPDTWLYHGTEDQTVDIDQSQRFTAAIRAEGGQAELLVYEGVGHSFFGSEPYLTATTEALRDHTSYVFGLSDQKPILSDYALPPLVAALPDGFSLVGEWVTTDEKQAVFFDDGRVIYTSGQELQWVESYGNLYLVWASGHYGKITVTDKAVIAIAEQVFSKSSPDLVEPWRFISLPDWHYAEKYANVWEAGAVENQSGWGDQGYASYDAYRAAMVAQDSTLVSKIHASFGGELMVMPGDTQNGHWDVAAFQSAFKSNPAYAGNTTAEVIRDAGHLVYSGMKAGFAAGGYTNLLVAIGDHEVGDNPWPANSTLSLQQPAFREGFADILNRVTPGGGYSRTNTIGTAAARPYGTAYESTSYAVQHKNVLFVTIDMFYQQDPAVNIGPEGSVKGAVVGEHLTWFTNLLAQASSIPSIDHIIVQSHLPGIYPVRQYQSSGMLVSDNEDSDFFRAMRQYGVDLYLAGEVHENTMTQDPASDLVQLVTRGNRGSNVTVVDVEEDRLYIELYKGQTNTLLLGSLEIDKSGEETVITGTGMLEPIDPDGLQVHLTFDESLAATTIVTGSDISRTVNTWCDRAFENHGGFAVPYTAWAKNCLVDPAGVIGGAASFGDATEVGITAIGPIYKGFERTVACWVKTTSSDRQIILDTTSYWRTTQFFNLSLSNGVFEVILEDGAVKQAGATPINDGAWHHVAAVVPWEPATLADVKMYVDGVEQTTATVQGGGTIIDTTPSNWPTFGTVLTGTKIDLWTRFEMVDFSGLMDEMCIWTRALSEAEIKALMLGASSRGYNASEMESLFKLYSRKTGTVDINGTIWSYDVGLSGNQGVFTLNGNTNTLILGDAGGVRSVDIAPPFPDPAAFLQFPRADSPTQVSMRAVDGNDASGGIEYRFVETSGNPGGSSSAWQSRPIYVDDGLLPDTMYAYTVTMRDALGVTGTAGMPASVTTLRENTVFYSGFEYSVGAPVVGMDATNLNGADGQMGSFSGAVENIFSFTTANGGSLLADGNSSAAGAPASSNWMITADFVDVALAGAAVSFDYGTRRTGVDHAKDNIIVGYDANNNEIFQLVISADTSTVGQRARLGYIDAQGTTIWDLPGAEDADNDIPFTAAGVNCSITLSLSATGFTITLDGPVNGYTTSEIAFNQGHNLAYLQFKGQGGANDGLRSGFYLDDIIVTGYPAASSGIPSVIVDIGDSILPPTQIGSGFAATSDNGLTAEDGAFWGTSSSNANVRGLVYARYSTIAGGVLPATIEAGTYTFYARVGNNSIGANGFPGLNDIASGVNLLLGLVAGFFYNVEVDAEPTKNNMYTEWNGLPSVSYTPPAEADPVAGTWTTWTFTWEITSESPVIGTDPYFGLYTKTGNGGGNGFWDDSMLSFVPRKQGTVIIIH